MILYSINKEKYIVEIKEDGIYLYEETAEDITEVLSRMTFSKTKKQPRKVLLQKITLIGSSYDLVFSLVDAIVNRSLQVGFNFENDTYANNLRIMFCLLISKLDTKFAFKYDKSQFAKEVKNYDIEQFIAIKRFIDSDKKKTRDKITFLNIEKQEEIDAALSEALELYASDDSDSEAEESDENDDILISSDFTYSITNYERQEKKKIKEAQNKINKFLMERNPEEDCLEVEGESIKIKGKSLNVLFCIPGFRGVNHMPLRFSDEARRLYRSREFQDKRVKLPYYSEAAQMSRFDFYRDINGAKVHLTEALENENRTALDDNSSQLEQLLLKMRDEDYILVKGLSGKIRLFSNYLHFLQHLYSNGIIKSQRFLREVLSRQLGPQLPNAYNPFVSESETAEHALRYGFGLKSLYQSAALHAHYHSDGKPAFPYLGEIHLSLRGMDVFSSSRERHQIRRLEKMYRVNPDIVIAPEMESTGFGWLHAGEMIYSETIKCPNFKGKWKNKYKEKFGLSKEQFNKFKNDIVDSDSKKKRMQIEVEIINHLIKHYSNVLLKSAVEIAKARKEILVFLDSDGTLCFDLPEREKLNKNDKENEAMRQQLESAMEKLCTDATEEIDVKLNSTKMVVYRISPKAFNKAVKDIGDVDHFLMEDEKLRTPLSQTSTPRTSTSSRQRSTSVNFSLSGSVGTPLSYRGFFKQKLIERDTNEDIERHIATQPFSPIKGQEKLMIESEEVLTKSFENLSMASSSTMFKGVAPTLLVTQFNNEEITFERHVTRGDGSCGFYALPIAEDRDGAKKLLLDNAENEEIRRMVGVEIREAVLARDLPEVLLNNEFYHQWLLEHEDLSEHEAINAHDQLLVEYTETIDAYRDFINNDTGGRGRLSFNAFAEKTSVLDALAQLANLRIHIFHDQRLFVSRGPETGTPTFLYHYQGQDTHFELMSILEQKFFLKSQYL